MKKKPLEGILCFIETFNEDGSDVSSLHGKILTELGAEISLTFHEKITHYICSNISPKRMVAAKLLNIFVLSPLWIEQCHQLQTKALETEFEYEIDVMKVISNYLQEKKIEHNSLLSQGDKKASVAIPLPSFKEFVLPTVDETIIKRRRSERISDLHESDDDDDNEEEEDDEEEEEEGSENEEFPRSHQQQRFKKIELKEAMDLSKSKPLPIVFVNKPYEKDWKKFEAKLAVDLILDGNGPGEHKRPFTILSRGHKRSHSVSSNQSSHQSEGNKFQSLSSKSLNRRKSRDDSPVSISDNSDETASSNSSTESEPRKKSYARAQGRSRTKKSRRKRRKSNAQEIDVKQANISIALSGFNKQNGEYDTMVEKLETFFNNLRSYKNKGPEKHNNASKKPFHIHPFEVDIDILKDSADYNKNFHYLIVSKNNQKRTLRILFALAQNIPILSEEWIYASISEKKWANPMDYRLERYKRLDLTKKPVFQNRLFYMLHSTRPTTQLLSLLIEKAGGIITRNINTNERIHFFLCGNLEDLKVWLAMKRAQNDNTKEITVLERLGLKTSQIVTTKYLWNAIEEQSCRYALKKCGEAISVLEIEGLAEDVKQIVRLKKIGLWRSRDGSSSDDTLGMDYDYEEKKRKGEKEDLVLVERRKRRNESKEDRSFSAGFKRPRMRDVASAQRNVSIFFSPSKKLDSEDEDSEQDGKIATGEEVTEIIEPYPTFLQEMCQKYCKKGNPEEMLHLQHFTDPFVDFVEKLRKKEEKKAMEQTNDNYVAASPIKTTKTASNTLPQLLIENNREITGEMESVVVPLSEKPLERLVGSDNANYFNPLPRSPLESISRKIYTGAVSLVSSVSSLFAASNSSDDSVSKTEAHEFLGSENEKKVDKMTASSYHLTPVANQNITVFSPSSLKTIGRTEIIHSPEFLFDKDRTVDTTKKYNGTIKEILSSPPKDDVPKSLAVEVSTRRSGSTDHETDSRSMLTSPRVENTTNIGSAEKSKAKIVATSAFGVRGLGNNFLLDHKDLKAPSDNASELRRPLGSGEESRRLVAHKAEKLSRFSKEQDWAEDSEPKLAIISQKDGLINSSNILNTPNSALYGNGRKLPLPGNSSSTQSAAMSHRIEGKSVETPLREGKRQLKQNSFLTSDYDLTQL